jgi:NAD-dependent SIR2 family protein deacetylase
VVFFGGTIPREQVSACEAALSRADALLVVGSSLHVYSGFRICRQAKDQGKPLVIANEGTTRADDIATLKIQNNALSMLSSLLEDYAWSDPTHSPNNRISHA